jgi:hypothetical protein
MRYTHGQTGNAHKVLAGNSREKASRKTWESGKKCLNIPFRKGLWVETKNKLIIKAFVVVWSVPDWELNSTIRCTRPNS